MTRALLLVGLAALAVAPALAQFATPEALVRKQYAHHELGQDEMRGCAPYPGGQPSVRLEPCPPRARARLGL